MRVRTLESPHPRATQLCSGTDSGHSCEMAEQQLLNHKQEEETKGEAGEQREPQPGGASVSVPSALTGAGSLRRASASLRERPGACPATLPGAFASEQREEARRARCHHRPWPPCWSRAGRAGQCPRRHQCPPSLSQQPRATWHTKPAQRSLPHILYDKREACVQKAREWRELSGTEVSARPGFTARPSMGRAGLYPDAPANLQGVALAPGRFAQAHFSPERKEQEGPTWRFYMHPASPPGAAPAP